MTTRSRRPQRGITSLVNFFDHYDEALNVLWQDLALVLMVMAGFSTRRVDAITVSELCQRVSAVIAQTFEDEIWVQGAISGLTRSATGHVYFNLVDPLKAPGDQVNALLPVALFASQKDIVNRILKTGSGIRMEDGVEIRIRGSLVFYQPKGRVQMVMKLIDPEYTIGQISAAREALLAQLKNEGLLDGNPSLTMPLAPLRIGLVTSGGSAAYHDFVRKLNATSLQFQIHLFDTRVQGEGAADGIENAIAELTDSDGSAQEPVEVIVIARGGGARSDLVVFDHEKVARAIANCTVPVITGIGHEIDRTVADEVAHTSTKTPTAAGRFLVDLLVDYNDMVEYAAARIHDLTTTALDTSQQNLTRSTTRFITTASRIIEREKMGNEHRLYRLGALSTHSLRNVEQQLDTMAVKISAHDPQIALQRGFSITFGSDGNPVKAADQVKPGDRLRTVTAHGQISSTVDSQP